MGYTLELVLAVQYDSGYRIDVSGIHAEYVAGDLAVNYLGSNIELEGETCPQPASPSSVRTRTSVTDSLAKASTLVIITAGFPTARRGPASNRRSSLQPIPVLPTGVPGHR